MRTMVANDYTVLPVGTKIDRAEIQTCPICGKNGLAIGIGGEVFYAHTNTITEDARGRIEFSDETCPSPTAPEASSTQQRGTWVFRYSPECR